MDKPKLITEETTIYEIVTNYPELKEVLLQISPKFKNLQNPVMLNTVAKITSVSKAAKVGGVFANEMLLKLNEALGLGEEYLAHVKSNIPKMQAEFMRKQAQKGEAAAEKPAWMEKAGGFETIDVRSLGEPFGLITGKVTELSKGQGIHMVQSFEPAPLIAYVSGLGCGIFVEKKQEDEVHIFFYKE